jgi:predicted dinucleotide-binding enzyme
MTIDGVRIIGLIGAGHIGSQVARAAIASGYDVVISNSTRAGNLDCSGV